MAETEALIVLDNERIETALTQPSALEQLLHGVREKIDSFEGNIDTAAARSEIASMAHKIARTKTAIDAVGKDIVAGAKAEIKKIDSARKQARDTLDGWKAEVRRPLTEWENLRKESEEAIARIRESGNAPGVTVEEIEATITRLNACNHEGFAEEYQDAALEAKVRALTAAEEARQKEMKRIESEKELEALRAEKAEREAKEAQARRDAEIAERAKREEAEKIKNDKALAEAEQEARRSDAARRKQIESEVTADLVAHTSLNDNEIASVWRAIAAESIRHIRVQW
jgi:chromosome segregation ATPase